VVLFQMQESWTGRWTKWVYAEPTVASTSHGTGSRRDPEKRKTSVDTVTLDGQPDMRRQWLSWWKSNPETPTRAAAADAIDLTGRYKLVALEGEPDRYMRILGVSYIARKFANLANYGVGLQEIQWTLERSAACMHSQTQASIPLITVTSEAAMWLDGREFELSSKPGGKYPGRCLDAGAKELRFALQCVTGREITLRYYRRGAQVLQTSTTTVDGEVVGTTRVFERAPASPPWSWPAGPQPADFDDPPFIGRGAAA